jgi:hypothetical protein
MQSSAKKRILWDKGRTVLVQGHSLNLLSTRYENLILLCANDHTMIDKHINDYSVDRLLVIKNDHEQWVLRRLTSLPANSGMAWSPKDPGAPIVLPRITSGRQAFNTIAGTMAYRVDSPPDDAAPSRSATPPTSSCRSSPTGTRLVMR